MTRTRSTAATIGRYALFQLPGTLAAGGVLALLVQGDVLGATGARWLFGLWIVGEIALFPALRVAYEADPEDDGAGGLVGAAAVVHRPLDPEGWVTVGAERWRAVAANGARIPAGDPVRVVAARGLVLVVEPAD